MIRLSQSVSEAIEHGRTVLVPSRQRSEAVRLAYSAQALAGGRRVWATPDVLPLDTWIAREIERRAGAGERLPRLLTPAEDWLLWRQCTSELTHGAELVARGPLADALRRAEQVAQEFHISHSAGGLFPGSEGQLLRDVRQAVAARCKALGAAGSALANRLTGLGGPRDVVLTGFERVTPRLASLVTLRGAAGCVTEVLRPELIARAPHARAVLAADTTEELERIAEWCRARLSADPTARLLVLMPGAPEARERLVSLIRQHIDPATAIAGDLAGEQGLDIAAIEGGVPLSRHPLVAIALQTLACLTGRLEYEDFSAWLCAPHWATSAVHRARLDLWLRERAPLEMDARRLLQVLEKAPQALRQGASEIVSRVRNALDRIGSGQASPRQWSERFAAALDALGWAKGRVLSSAEVQTCDRFTQLLDDFGGLTASAPLLSRDSAVQWLSELAGRTSFRPASGDALVTVSAQLDDPIVRYDGIWVCGLHADAWPAPVQPDPFLPLGAQIAAGVPFASAQGRASEAAALMSAWAAATQELVISCPARADDVQLSPSPLVLRFVGQVEERTDPTSAIWLPQRIRREGRTELVQDAAGPAWDASKPLPSGTRSVELQNLCPFRAYAELRLGSTPLEAPEPGVPADVRGQLLHKSLEKVWKTLRDSDGLAARAEDAIRELVMQCVREAAVEVMGPVGDGQRSPPEERECRRAARLIQQLCELERTRTPFAVREMEYESTLQLAGASLRLRIDRLDALGSGGLAILDYKSGRPITGDWYSERPSHPQLLAYLAAVGRETVAMATISVTAREIRFDGVAAASNLLPRVRAVEAPPELAEQDVWASRQDEWIARVERLVEDFLAGRAAVDPRPKACEYCHVVNVCRISDAGAEAVEVNIGD